MATANFAANYTTTWRVGYINGGETHHIQFKLAKEATASNNAQRQALTALITALRPALFDDFVFVDAQIRPAGSNYFSDDTTPTTPDMSTAMDASDATLLRWRDHQVSFVATNGIAGSTRCSIIGVNVDTVRVAGNNTWRQTTSVSAIVTAAIAALNGGGFRTSGDGVAPWKNYANLGVNDYWQNQHR